MQIPITLLSNHWWGMLYRDAAGTLHITRLQPGHMAVPQGDPCPVRCALPEFVLMRIAMTISALHGFNKTNRALMAYSLCTG